MSATLPDFGDLAAILWVNMVQFDDTFDAKRIAEIRRKEEESLIQSLAAQSGYEYVDLRGVSISPKAMNTIEENAAREAKLLPFEITRKNLSVAIRNPNNPDTQTELQKLTDAGYTLSIFMTPTASLEHGWARYADLVQTAAVKHGVLDIDPEHIAEQAARYKTPEAVSNALIEIRTLNTPRRISQTLETIFAGALALHASDIHIEPEEFTIRLRFRLDGVLHDIIDLEGVMYERIMSRLKLLSSMVLNIKDQAQDGRFTFTVGEQDVEVRSSVIPGAYGESIVMRLLDPSVASFTFENLGLNHIIERVMREELARPNGLIVTTGPTGSGKTTALYAFLQEVHTPDRKIITIEDPVEYKIDDIVQTQASGDYTFASGLRAVLRQDPDVIMVGEIRDREVAETALHAAQTGHLVFSTLHTNSAVGAFPRLIDLGVDYRTMGTAVNLILGQRLVRILCEHCKASRAATPDETELIAQVLKTHPEPPTVPSEITVYEPVGCAKCKHTGFTGRQAVFEAVRMDDAVEEAIIRDPREQALLEAALPQGIPTMAEDGIEKVLKGITSLKELRRVVDLTDGRHTAAAEEAPADDDFMSHVV